jgi:hypothetical protein
VCVFLLTLVFSSDVPPYHPGYGRNRPSYSYEVYGGEAEAAVPDLIFVLHGEKMEGKSKFLEKRLYRGIDWRDEMRRGDVARADVFSFFLRRYIAV